MNLQNATVTPARAVWDKQNGFVGLLDEDEGVIQLVGRKVFAPYLTKAQWCYLDSSNAAFAANYTQHVQMTLEAPFDAVQIGVVNGYTTGGAQTVKVSVSVMAAAGTGVAPLNNAGTWVNAGAGGASLAVPVATVANSKVGIAWGDVVPLASMDRSDGGVMPLLCVRVENPTGNNLTGIVPATNAATPWETGENTGGRLYRLRSEGSVLGVTTPGSMTTTNTDTSYGAPIIVRYWLRGGVGRTFVIGGDSIACAYGQTVNNSYGGFQAARAALSTITEPIELCVIANSGYTMGQIANRCEALAPTLKGAVAIVPIGSPNSLGAGTITAAIVAAERANVARINTSFADQRTPVIETTVLPANFAAQAWGASDALRIAMNATRLAGSSGVKPVVDLAKAASGAVDGNGQITLGYAEADGIHPTYAFTAVASPLIQAVIK